jgi:hypothetical protein
VRQKVLQHLVVAPRNRFDHALHVALHRLHQTAQILLSRTGYAVFARTQHTREAFAESPESASQSFERSVMPNPVFRSSFQ